MKLSTIWTLPGMAFAERLRRTRDSALLALAHRLPRRLAYWSFIDTGVRHVGGSEIVPEVAYMTILQRIGDEVESA